MIFKPYVHVINDLIIPQAFIFASIVKYAELILGVAFFIGFLGLAVFVAIFLHANYLCIADQEYLIYFNVLMIASEFVILHSNSLQTTSFLYIRLAIIHNYALCWGRSSI